MINRTYLCFVVFAIFLFACPAVYSQGKHSFGAKSVPKSFTVLEYNVENLFDCEHDSLKDDYQYLPDSKTHWTKSQYWKKLNAVARGIVMAGTVGDDFVPPALIGLCEVENDSVLTALTKRSLLKGANYEYVMTDSPDRRGVDVALLYSPYQFQMKNAYSIRIDTLPGMRPTRDILYAKGAVAVSGGSTADLHVFVVHAPSRTGGERPTRAFRMAAAKRLLLSVDSVRAVEKDPMILLMGDFNDYYNSPALQLYEDAGFVNISARKTGDRDKSVGGTYRYQGEWESLDHILVTDSLVKQFHHCSVVDHPELLEPDNKYGGVKPKRFFQGPIPRGGYSDHLPLKAEFRIR